jgi:glycosyltransferase involved in cell wall biosynthesis
MSNPRVTVGLLVLNGERSLPRALDTLLGQTYDRLEVLVMDNASTDRSPDIAREYARSDERVRYERNPETVSGVATANRALALGEGELFVLAAVDDWWEPRFVEACVRELVADERVVLAYPRARLLASNGEEPLRDHGLPREDLVPDSLDTRGLDPGRRCVEVVRRIRSFTIIHGVFRLEAARAVGGFPLSWGPELPFLLALALRGTFAFVPEALFVRRVRAQELPGSAAWKRRLLRTTFGAEAETHLDTPLESLNRDLRDLLVSMVLESELPPWERVRTAADILAAFETDLRVRLPAYRMRTWLPGRSYLELASLAARRTAA